jgi:outer membrane receptor for ferrienterochelin and colicin
MGLQARAVLTGAMLLVIASPGALAQEKKKTEKPKEAEALEEEMSELQEADYPDLVGADDEGEIIDEFAFLAEEAIVESAARHKQEIGMSPSAITVITREDIETSGANTIPDLLRMVPGMDVILTSIALPAIISRLYWTDENNQYLVLIDGREANLELLGQPVWEAQPVSVEDIERIEVIRGPGSSLYGANAVAGVVSITTRAVPEETSGWARVIGGEAALMEAGARAATRFGDWRFSLSGGAKYSGRFSDPRETALDVWKLRAMAEYRISESKRLLLDAGISSASGVISAGGVGRVDAIFEIRTVRLAYDSESVSGQLYWYQMPCSIDVAAPLEFHGIRLARLVPADVDTHTVDAEVQWTLPGFFEPLLLIVGGGGRFSWLGSDQMLDAETYADISSTRYHQPGISYMEARGGAFVHGELAPSDWVTVTGGLRLDYNTETAFFLSPRVAAVFQPVKGQYLRMGVARAFRKPAFLETGAHLMAEFPEDSPIKPPGYEFQEFLTHVLGNSHVGNEKLLSFDLGYLGQFLDDRLRLALDLYYNRNTDTNGMVTNIVENDQGLPDLSASTIMFERTGQDLDILGSELSVRFNLSKSAALIAQWTYRGVLDKRFRNTSPKHLITLGGHFRLPSGILGSLYLFTRSEFTDSAVENPAGMMEPTQSMHMDNVMLLLGKLGRQWGGEEGVQLEAGVKLFLPVSPFSGHLFRFYEKGGGVTPGGKRYGGEELARAVTAYLQGSF